MRAGGSVELVESAYLPVSHLKKGAQRKRLYPFSAIMGYGEYTVCTCGAWIWNSRITQNNPYCDCGRRWRGVKKLKRQRSQDSNKPQTPGSNKEQGVFEALTHNWAGLGAATQEALVKAGFQPPEKEEVDPLLKALKDNKDLLPKAVRVALDNHNGQELTIQEEGDQSSKDLVSASHKCRILTKKKIILQDKVTAAKESLRVQLQELQALDEQIKQAQKAVEDCQSKLAQSMSGAGDVDADNRLGKAVTAQQFTEIAQSLGISLTAEQTELLQAKTTPRPTPDVTAPPGLEGGAPEQQASADSGEEKDVNMSPKPPDNRVRSRTPPKK